MSALLRTRRLVARVLPRPLKLLLRRVLPAWVLQAPARLLHVAVALPSPPPGLGPVVRPEPTPAVVVMAAPHRSYVPRLLARDGLAGYEPETMAAFLAAISTLGATEVFDIGANVGIFSIVASALTTARVTGFEPAPQVVETFRTTIARNRLSCAAESMALGRTSGSATLFLSAITDSSNSLRADHRPAAGTTLVQVERLDDYVARTGRRPAVIKLDTETTEPDVLAGGMLTIRDFRPWIICEVLAGQTEEAVAALLGPMGYRYHHLGPQVPPVETPVIVGDSTYRYRDWLLTPAPPPPAFGMHYAAWLAAIRATPIVTA